VVFQQASIFSSDVSISGRSSHTNYYISGAMTDERGLIFNDDQKRTTLRANIENKVNDWFRIGVNATFSHRDLSGMAAGLDDAYSVSPLGTFYHPDGQPTQYPVPEETASANPMWDAMLTDNEQIADNLFSNLYAIVDFPVVKGLSYRVNYSPNFRWDHSYDFLRQDEHVTFNNTRASKYVRNGFEWVWENILNYEKSIGDDHYFDLTLMYGRNHSEFESTTATASG